MTEKAPPDQSDQEKKQTETDRKFIAEPIDARFLDKHCEKPFNLTVHWIVTGENEEKKVARKEFDDGTVEMLYIEKVTVDGDIIPTKRPIKIEEYQGYVAVAEKHLKKRRYEFVYNQNGIAYNMKYDVYPEGHYMLEVDAVSKQEHERDLFEPGAFKPCLLKEVTHQLEYYGYRMVDVIKEHDNQQGR